MKVENEIQLAINVICHDLTIDAEETGKDIIKFISMQHSETQQKFFKHVLIPLMKKYADNTLHL